jgi:outer membrane cobalamin receptor
MSRAYSATLGIIVILTALASATIFGSIRGLIHDPQHHPVSGATVVLRAAHSDWSQTTTSNATGEFSFEAVPLGDYSVIVQKQGFAEASQDLTLASSTTSNLHLQLRVAAVSETVDVSAAPVTIPTDSVTPTTLVNRLDIERTPGADRTNSLQMITDFVPGTYVTHDMLHMRGGHQVSWLIDGVPIPNTNIASNLGPQIDPKDIDYLETQRGSYDADYGDRTFGVFNVVPRTGFERNNEAELVLTFGNFYQTNDQFNLGGHTDRFAYFASVNGNRSDYGLQTPVPEVLHDAQNGVGGFASFIYNRDLANQFRLVTSLRKDYYQIPYDPDRNSAGNQQYDSSGLRDGQHESDAYVDFSWVRKFGPTSLLTVSPFYHYNCANYEASPNDLPVATTSDRASNYGGLQATVSTVFPRNNNFEVGLYSFGQHDSQFFRNLFNDNSYPNFSDHASANGGLIAVFLQDRFKVNSWLTLLGGFRQTHFTSDIVENATSPRTGGIITIPRLHWAFRGFYGQFYQAPPLVTATGPLLQFANNQSLNFVPLHGERDDEWQFGVAIPFHGWTLDADNFKTRIRNFLDHNNIGESNIFFPLTFAHARVRAWELTLRSPLLFNRAQAHLAYSNQIADARGPLTGGLICASPADPACADNGYGPVDHDQRNTLSVGFDSSLPWRSFASANVYYGSGFTNGSPNTQYPGQYLPSHTTFDVSLGKTFGENFTVSFTALNVANRRVLLDNSLTFGGFHWNDPRQLYAGIRYRFRY